MTLLSFGSIETDPVVSNMNFIVAVEREYSRILARVLATPSFFFFFLSFPYHYGFFADF
jgi:hypothetical protein